MMKKAERSVTKRTRSVRRLNESTPFAIKESFNQLRTNIMYTPNNSTGCPIYGITSAEMYVGKSTISANLAISFSQIGKKVLLIDGDMRRPSQHRIFEYDKSQAGFSELLAGIEKNDKDVICNPCPNLYLLTSGAIPPNPSELLLSKKFEEYINRWKDEYDIIFIDFPPAGIVTDPVTVSSHLNGFIFVAMANRSNAVRVTSAIDSIKAVDGKITGLVLNATNSKATGKYGSGKYGYRYSYRYSYQYGYSSDKK